MIRKKSQKITGELQNDSLMRKKKRRKWPWIAGGIAIVLFIMYSVLIYFLVNAALVPSFMKKLEAFSEVTEQNVSEQKHTSDIEINHRESINTTNEWLKTASRDTYKILSDDGYRLVATMFHPAKAPAFATHQSHQWVLLLHGYTGWKEEMYPIACEYVRRGYHALVPDLRCQGESEGDFIGMGYTDSKDCLLWLKLILDTDPEARICIHGQSMGAATALILSGDPGLPDAVTGIVSDCSYTDAYAMFRDKIKDWFSLPAFPLVDSSRLMLLLRGGYDLYDASAIDAVKKSHTPTLFIHGLEDRMIDPSMSRELYEACSADKKRLLLIAGAGHAQSQDKDPEGYYRAVFGFISAGHN